MSPVRYLRALVRPRETFDGWSPRTEVVLGIAVLLCALNAASVAYAGDAVAAEVSGTVTVDNPERPPDWICDDSDMAMGDSDACDAPETIQKSLRPAASSAVGDVMLKAVTAPATWLLLIASLFAVVSGRAGGPDGDVVVAFREGLGIATVAAVPGSLRSLARPVAVQQTLADWTHPQSLDGVRTAAVHALFPDGTLWLAVVALSGLWTAVVVYGGARAAFETERGLGAVVAAVAFATTAGSAAFPNGGWIASTGGSGLLFVALGLFGFLGAYTYISLSKEFELIGFSGSRSVEPKPWYVGFHRLGALCFLAIGFVLLDGLALV